MNVNGVIRSRLAQPQLWLWLLIILFSVFFSAFSIQQYATFDRGAADPQHIDQAVWNTLHGRLLVRTLGDRQVSRVADHLEPVLIPLALAYVVWDDVRLVLILQALVLALGGLPVYWLARERLARRVPVWASWLGLAFVIAYLLSPALQAASLAGLHAEPFFVTPWLCAVWYATQRRYLPMWLWAMASLLVSDNLSTLTALLGVYLLMSHPDAVAANPLAEEGLARRRIHGALLTAVGVVWYVVATFGIVAPLAHSTYGAWTPFDLARASIVFSGSPVDVLTGVITTLAESTRREYVAGLLASVGWLALLAPEYLLLGLPVLAANVLSSNPVQFSGEQQYSVSLVPILIMAALYGTERLVAFLDRSVSFLVQRFPRLPHINLLCVIAWLLLWSVGYQIRAGWTPLAWQFQWPRSSTHTRLLSRFVAQIPAAAAVSTTPALHLHLAHREKIYRFPTIADAAFVLLDVTGGTDVLPKDVLAIVDKLRRESGYTIIDAADGYLLLGRDAASAGDPTVAAVASPLPSAFYSFARTDQPQPQFRVDAVFGGRVRLLGFDISDDTRWRLTTQRFYWQVQAPLSEDTRVNFQVLTPAGQVADDGLVRPPPALVWYPPASWQPGEVVVVETVPWYLPAVWAVALNVDQGGQHLSPLVSDGDKGRVTPDNRLLLPAWARQDGWLSLWSGPYVTEASATFGPEPWLARLVGQSMPLAVAPGKVLPVALRWQAGQVAPRDFELFLQLRDLGGYTVVQKDVSATWFVPLPTSRWEQDTQWTAADVSIPATLAPGRYDLVMGWYDRKSDSRLPLTMPSVRDEFLLGPVVVDPWAGHPPDIRCLMAPPACTSQP